MLGVFRDSPGQPNQVELVRAVEPVTPSAVNRVGLSSGDQFTDVVTDLWYVPLLDPFGRSLTPEVTIV